MFRKLGKLKKQVMPTQDNQFKEPWRKMNWNEKKDLEQKLRNFNISYPEVQQIRILLVGPIGSGKSSFINSVNNVFQGRITSKTLTDTTSGKSFTKEYRSHSITGRDGKPLLFVFNDTMGLEAEEGCGVQEDDVVKALQGCVKEGYRFNPESVMAANDQRFRKDPGLKHQVSCLVYVLPADSVSLMDEKVFKKIKNIREKASDLHIPQAIIMTKPDVACPLVKTKLTNIYHSKKIRQTVVASFKMQECCELVGVPMNHVFPVKNYHEEIDTDDDIDVLILKALDQIVNIGNDSLGVLHSNTDET